ncbi:MAG: response regulator transcription factor [Dokdonella sp.]
MHHILIVDDHPLFRAALRQSVTSALTDVTISEATDLVGTLAALNSTPETDLVLLDLHMPGSRGLSGLAALRGQFPAVAVAIVSANDDARVIRRALDHGACGFISKSSSFDDIAAALHCVLEGGEWIPTHLRTQVAQVNSSPDDSDLAARLASLTEQQFRVLGLVADGLLNKQIADRLGIQERTVKAHVSAIFERLRVRNRTQASLLLSALDLAEPARSNH